MSTLHARPKDTLEDPAERTTRRVAIIGSGMIAQVHRRATIVAGGAVTGVLSSSTASTERVAADWGVKGFRSFDELLDSDVDVVNICTPNATHADYALAALAAGKHVICEKPLGLTLPEAEKMDRVASDSGLVATVPFVYRYHPVVRELRARRLAGEFGELNLIHGSYLQDWMLQPAAGGWRIRSEIGGRSRAFADVGSHWCDLVEWVTGERFVSVMAATSIAYPTRPEGNAHAFDAVPAAGEETVVDTEDSAVALFRTSSGILANTTISQVAAGRKNRLWFEMDGSKGSAVFDQENPESAWLGGERESRLIVRDPGVGAADSRRLSSLPSGHSQGYAQCFENFISDTYAAIDGAEPEGLPTFADGLRTSHIVDSMLRSAATHEWTTI